MEFRDILLKFYDKNIAFKLLESLDDKPVFGLRLNPNKLSNTNYEFLEKHPYVNNAYIFDKEKYSFGKDIYHDVGCYYIQDNSAMMVGELLDIKEDDLVLDMCAAPGGKTTQVALKTSNTVYCNDMSFSRALDMLENIERLGLENCIVLNTDASKLSSIFSGTFDKIILDAPCSGEGMFRKNKLVEEDYSLEKVERLSKIQKELIINAYKMLKKGGVMSYSTCTYNCLENENVIKYLIDNTNASLIAIKEDERFIRGIDLKEAIHLMPFKFKGEGHFICLIKCNDDHESNIKLLKSNIDNKSYEIYKRFEKECLDETINKDSLYIVDNNLYKLPKTAFKLSNINILKYGLYLGEIKDKYFIPSHHLGSSSVRWKNIINFNKDSKEVLDYIKGLSFKVDSTINGYAQVRVDDIPFTVCKITSNTIKNLYPKKLRK